MPISWIEYKGFRILYSDYRNLVSEERMLANLKEEEKIYESITEPILVLNDYRDTYVSKKFLSSISELAKKHKGKTKKASILGVKGIKKILLSAYSKITGEQVKSFDNEEEAKEYLII